MQTEKDTFQKYNSWKCLNCLRLGCVHGLNYEAAAWMEYFSPNSELVKNVSGSK